MNLKKKFFKFFVYSILLFIFVLNGIYLYAKMLPKLDIKNVNTFYLYTSNNELYYQGSGGKEWVNLENISNNLIKATINIEDKKFYQHHGIDILRVLKAGFNNIKNGEIKEGASTITQQYAKNLYLDFDKTFKRKLQELWYTIQIETHYTKDEILEGYLNTINYGHGNYGIKNASNFYFNKDPIDLNLAESIILANIPKSPSNYSPINNYELANNKKNKTLKKLLDNKVITEDEYNEAINYEIKIYGKKEKVNLTTIMYYQDAVFKELKTLSGIPSTYLESGGLKIYTNLDLNAQSILEKNINKTIKNNDLQVNSIIMEPGTSKIIALVGGRDYNKSEFNRSINSKRQVGSVMKPILYYTALENGFTESSSFLSEKTTFYLDNDKTYTPQNYGNIYGNKEITMALAIALSDNVYAIKTHLFLGEKAMIDTAYKMGIKTKLEEIASLPLGTTELNIIEITNAYATLASNGTYNEPYLISKVCDMNDNVLYEYTDKSTQVLDENYVYILNNMLSLTYDYDMIDYSYPTNISIKALLSNKYAIKSGSTDTDNWVIGFNKNAVMSIWVGYDNNKTLKEDDYKYIKKIWAKTMEEYLKDKDNTWYTKPNNIIGVFVDPITGKLANEKTKKRKLFYYLVGTEPSDTITAMKEVNNKKKNNSSSKK